MTGRDTTGKMPRLNWQTYLFIECILGLFLVLPSNLEMLRGLQGVIEIGNGAIPIRTLYLLNALTFILNLITGPLICMAIGAVLLIRNQQRSRSNSIGQTITD